MRKRETIMFSDFKNLYTYLSKKYYFFSLEIANLKNKTRILPIDFDRSWQNIIWNQKPYLFIALINEIITQIFYTIVPILIGFILESKNVTYFLLLILAWLLAIIIEYITAYFIVLLEIQCVTSIQYNAYEFFLAVDPIYHTMRSTGQLFAKIERCSRAYEDFLDIVMYELSPTIISISTVVVSFIFVNFKLGLLALILLIIIGIFSIVLNIFTGTAFEGKLIDADDKVKSLSVENLTQVQLIRSCFATNQAAHIVKEANNQLMYKEGTAWIASSFVNLITRTVYLASIFILGLYIINITQSGYLSTTIAITLIITYIRGTYEIIRIGRKLRKLIKSITRIVDLFTFIRKFGKQTYPVLSDQKSFEKKAEIELDKKILLHVTDLHFDYNPKAQIFEHHQLSLEVPSTQKNKLYGFIGPSGIGKTTLLSILGGQLKPSKGEVILNNIPIYSVNDMLRRKLIAIQGQAASNLSGTLRSNLLIGLPMHSKHYTDEQLINILKEVGVWSIFEEKEGLNTPIGEGGLTLSGGQRQRLNFAGLYLRASYYKPLLILIDEPTSSLDEISEKAITNMINRLAQHALTFVIAHRIKTLESAVGILDFSLLEEEKDIKFYSTEELKSKSTYYRRLIEGSVNIDG